MRQGLLALIFVLISNPATAQIMDAAELSSADIERLDRNKTIIVMTGGILEEHGPHLPVYADAYLSEFLAERTSEALVADEGLTILRLPTIPLGVGSPEDFGGRKPFSGSYTVRPETLRAVYMDLASALGDDGFRKILVFHAHGSPSHNRAMLDAARYFEETYGGAMAILTAFLLPARSGDDSTPWSEDQRAENGLDVHAGGHETSDMLFLKPHLVDRGYADLEPMTARAAADLMEIAAAPGWPGYFGSPRTASAKAAAVLLEERVSRTVELASNIVKGFDWTSLSTRADVSGLPSAFVSLDENLRERSRAEAERQKSWLERTERN